ncbi:MAG: type II toxin-antitoxin system VapC family toxin [Rhodopseudomonas sp.]|uniref:type II toxin-antitoxin system VapC family toxin n=1 Tax=Rhodopseudomonas sp. TaxID=1078 RepID=UPI0017D605DC|nr:type II toxin-antitoxin system VapC family toxin [Rhodopseudomonas sp.]NVN85796.1 type II toxin-antitoxin system VapC family toxin [Rhodopseudomonas sp.]
MTFVLDASTAVAWCFDEANPIADFALDLAKMIQPSAPAILWFELRNAALVGIRRGRITADRTVDLLARIERIRIEISPLPTAPGAIFALANRHRLSFYDAAYLELAQREGIALATLDQALARAARAEAVPLIGAA